MPRARIHDLRRRVYLALDQGPAGDGIGVVIDRILVVLIVINLIAMSTTSSRSMIPPRPSPTGPCSRTT